MSGEGCRVKRAITGPTGMTCELRFEERERLRHADSREKRATEGKGCANTLHQDPSGGMKEVQEGLCKVGRVTD